ncbi:MAG: PHP domain-containing protein [Tannerella sp.]|nr:PHP domain-containing protein [Tannerella sp.]
MSNRREFLKRSALVGTAAVWSPLSRTLGMEAAPQKSSPAAEAGDTYTVNMEYISAPNIPPRQIVVPDVGGFKTLKGDFHIHTLFSDGGVMPVDRVNEAVQNGLDVISITDHIEYRPFFSKVGKWKLNEEQASNYNLWYEIARPDAEKQNLLLIRGAEITKSTMAPGHFNALFVQDTNPVAAVVDDWRKMLQVAAEQGAFLLWNHPGWEAPKSGGIEPGAPLRFTREHEDAHKKGWLHGIEIFNYKEYYPVVSDWCNERDLALFANSDIHDSELNTYGIQNPLRPITLVLARERTLESVREALFARRTIAWAAGTLWGRDPWLPELFKASVEIKTVTPGTLELTNKSSLPIFVALGGVSFELPKDVKRQVYLASGVRNITVTNWMTAMNRPLEVSVH